MNASRSFVPAAGQDRWLPLYDPLTKLLGAPSAHLALIEQANLAPGHRVLDIGCGTGSLAVTLKSRHPQVQVVALDPDEHALARAGRKAERAHATIEFVRGFADTIPFPDASFDRVFSSFMLHHLTSAEKAATLADVRRVLKSDGSFHLLDFAAPDDHHRHGVLARLLHRGEHLHDHATDTIVAMLGAAGLGNAELVAIRRTLFGPIAFHRAKTGVKTER